MQLLDDIHHAYIHFYSYSMLGTDENNTKIKMLTVLLTTIKKARKHCQDGTAIRIETPVRMDMSTQIIKTSGLTIINA